MEKRSTWGSPTEGKSVREKIPYTPLQRVNDQMTDSQREGVRIWNLMVNTLRDNGLMDDKK